MFKILYNCAHFTLVRLCSKSFKLGFRNVWTNNFQIFKLGFKEEPETKLPTFTRSWRKEGSSRKTSTSVLLSMLNALTMWITTNWKTLKEMGIPDNFTCLLRTCRWFKKQQLEPDKEQQTGSKLEKKYDQTVYCHPAYLTYMQSTSCEMPS